jgi:hypothetical protein
VLAARRRSGGRERKVASPGRVMNETAALGRVGAGEYGKHNENGAIPSTATPRVNACFRKDCS